MDLGASNLIGVDHTGPLAPFDIQLEIVEHSEQKEVKAANWASRVSRTSSGSERGWRSTSSIQGRGRGESDWAPGSRVARVARARGQTRGHARWRI